MNTEQNQNIPSISVNTMVRKLGALYAAAINGGLPLKSIPAPFIWGPPGIGKSQGIRQLAEVISKETGKEVCVIDVRLLLFSPVDLRGVPMADANREFTDWLRPRIFALDPSVKKVNIIFLDELSAAPPSVQAAAYQITLDRTVGEHKLPENTIVIAAGNRTTDRSVAYRIPMALANRMVHFQVSVDFASWRDWAVRGGIHPLVVGYLSYDSSKLYREPEGRDDVAYPTPRSWEFVSGVLFASGVTDGRDLPDDLHYLLAGCIGTGAAVEFEGWCNVYRALPSAEEIFAGRKMEYPRKPDVLYALVSSMVYYASANDPSIDRLENACRFAARFPEDYKTVLYGDLQKIPGCTVKLDQIPEFRTWLNRRSRSTKK